MADKMLVVDATGKQKAVAMGSSSTPVLLTVSVVNGELIVDYLAQLTPSLVNGELLVDIL